MAWEQLLNRRIWSYFVCLTRKASSLASLESKHTTYTVLLVRLVRSLQGFRAQLRLLRAGLSTVRRWSKSLHRCLGPMACYVIPREWKIRFETWRVLLLYICRYPSCTPTCKSALYHPSPVALDGSWYPSPAFTALPICILTVVMGVAVFLSRTLFVWASCGVLNRLLRDLAETFDCCWTGWLSFWSAALRECGSVASGWLSAFECQDVDGKMFRVLLFYVESSRVFEVLLVVC